VCITSFLHRALQDWDLNGDTGVCSAKTGGDASGRQQARTVLQEACRKGAYDAATDAVQIFMPACPLLKCLRMLQVISSFPGSCF
jgi:hypothetical protein